MNVITHVLQIVDLPDVLRNRTRRPQEIKCWFARVTYDDSCDRSVRNVCITTTHASCSRAKKDLAHRSILFIFYREDPYSIFERTNRGDPSLRKSNFLEGMQSKMQSFWKHKRNFLEFFRRKREEFLMNVGEEVSANLMIRK